MSSAHVVSVDRPGKPPQFTLRQLIGWTVWVAVGLALITQLGEGGLAIFWFGSIFVAIVYGATVGNSVWWGTGVAGLIFTGCVCVLLPGVSTPRGPARRSQCSNNLKQIMLGLQNYHDTYGALPPAYIADASGKPMHSWRVLILPFCEQKNLYDAYDFNEPWNGPNNSKLAKDIPWQYMTCPSDPNARQLLETSYLAVTGPGTTWPGATPLNIAQITDGTSCTIAVVEVHHSGVNWMEPRDLHILQMPLTINAPRGPGICSSHPDRAKRPTGANVGFVDGHVQFLPNTLPPETLRALLTIAGGEKLPPEF